MEKVLLLVIAALMATSASAQLKVSAPQKVARPETHAIPAPKLEVAQMRTPGTPVAKAPKRVEYHEAYYNRPAGMYPGSLFMEPDGSPGGIAFAPYFATKPFAPYTFTVIYDNETPNTAYEWNFNGGFSGYIWDFPVKSITLTYDLGLYLFPVVQVMDGDKWYEYFMQGNYQGMKFPSHIMSAPNAAYLFSDIDEGGAILVSSKNFCWGGFQNDHDTPFTYYSGMDPYGNNESGFWFGKNGGTVTNAETGAKRTLRIDGIAQAFEKPTHPYVLKRVVLDATEIEVLDQVDMTCKIYKMDGGIPAYIRGGEVALPEVPGELVATGRATLTPETDEYIIFTLYDEHDGLEVEYTPTIDYDMLVVIDGYNDPGMENLKSFSALISTDINHDEGFGELAYLKFGLNNDDGSFSGDYVWAGLNNFFTSGEMMTGLSIFLDIDNPFLTFYYNQERGEYTFPEQGGVMGQVFQDDGDVEPFITSGIEFFSWVESADDGWTLTCNGGNVPDWLSIELTDGGEDGEFNYHVNAAVVAEPLPQGMHYREAVVRFGFPGAYKDYKFMQRENEYVFRYDMNGDGEVSIADLDDLLDLIIREVGDFNVTHVNALIDYILTH